jgi:hypothetical protein
MVRFERNKVYCSGTVRKVHKEAESLRWGGVGGQCPYLGHAIASSVCLPMEHSKGRGALPMDNRKHAQTVTDIVLCLLNKLLDWNMAVFLVTLILAP